MCLSGLAFLVGVAYMSYDYDYQNKRYDYDYQNDYEENWNLNGPSLYNYNCTTFRLYNCLDKTLQCNRPIKDCGCNGCYGCFDVSCMKKTPRCQIEGKPGVLCSWVSFGVISASSSL